VSAPPASAAFFDAIARRYDRTYGRSRAESTASLARVLALLAPRSHVLDLGVGTGRELPALLDAGHDPVGLDASREMLALCARRARPIPLVLGDLWERLPWEDASFDAVLALHGTLASVILIVAWAGALAGIVLQLVWLDHPKWASSLTAMALGWVGVATLTQLPASIGWAAVGVLIGAGALYSAGAVIYARERPNPLPGVFGYHEVFHALVLAAASLHYAVIAFAVLPHG